MEKFFLVCDESGAKGYSDNKEQYEGEIGVMGGYVVPNKTFSKVRSETSKIRDMYLNNGKLHITDLEPKQQEQLRDEVFAFIKKNNIICVYDAIHTEGFHGYSHLINEMAKKASINKGSNIMISHHEKWELLHSELFVGVFGKAISLCSVFVGNVFHLKVITDQIDDSIIKTFNKQANEFLNFGNASNAKKVTGFNPDTQQVVSGNIVSTVIDSNNVLDDLSGIKFDIQTEDSGLTLLADVIANSINYHFKNRNKNDISKSLNTKLAIKGHPLKDFIYGSWGCSKSSYFADALYMHPKNIKLD